MHAIGITKSGKEIRFDAVDGVIDCEFWQNQDFLGIIKLELIDCENLIELDCSDSFELTKLDIINCVKLVIVIFHKVLTSFFYRIVFSYCL